MPSAFRRFSVAARPLWPPAERSPLAAAGADLLSHTAASSSSSWRARLACAVSTDVLRRTLDQSQDSLVVPGGRAVVSHAGDGTVNSAISIVPERKRAG